MKNENSAHSFTEGCDVYSQPENVLTYGDLLRLKALNDELLEALESAKLDLSFVEQTANDQLNYSVRGTLNKVESAIKKAKGI